MGSKEASPMKGMIPIVFKVLLQTAAFPFWKKLGMFPER